MQVLKVTARWRIRQSHFKVIICTYDVGNQLNMNFIIPQRKQNELLKIFDTNFLVPRD